ncbi:NMDA receptor-regulated protein 1-domain-containing protein [Geopyxis carbonaria]|nr:NMDA receptor-regulated protein 1-domain-containing protein [Geopyxis carbonaria]
MPSAQPLASKDASLFKQVIKCYETKQYKKGLKACEQILRKNPKHGETMAMKGLIINTLGRTEEAFAIAKDALRQDMRSHVCWHVYGLLYRAEKNFEESVKAYKMALRFDPESPQILRDLALLQVQMRDYLGYVETRKILMSKRPQLRQNWTALAIAYHMSGQLGEAEKVLSKYEDTIKDEEIAKWNIEHWEACLYKNTIIAEQGDIERALQHLESVGKKCPDKPAVLEYRASYLLKLGRYEEAEKAYRVLIDRNAEKRDYYMGLEASMKINPANRQPAKAIYDEYAEKFERSDAPRRMPLDFLEGEEFKQAADVYLQKKLKKGVPSTFANVKALYADQDKREILFNLVKSYSEAQEKQAEGEANGITAEFSRFRLWTLYYLAQHYDHYRTRDVDRALHYLNKAIGLEPETVELHMTYARVHKHAGDLQQAMERMNEARNMDKSDRYINTKTAKYQLRNDHTEEALETMSLFTRNEPNGGPLGDLIEMQCVWYLSEDAESNFRQGKLGLALKRYQALWKIFEDWAEDQFDFHTFSLRKGQVRAYVDMLKWEDTLRSHPYYARAALGAIKVYIQMADNPGSANGVGSQFDNMTEAEKKKALKKAKKDEQKAQEQAAAAAQKAKDEKNKNAQVGDEAVKKEDTDPLGTQLLKTETPLEEANRWLKPLLELSPERLEAQLAGFEVHSRRKKYLLALKCLSKARSLSPEDPKVHEISVRLRKIANELPDDADFSPESKEAFLEELEGIIPKETDLTAFNEQYIEKNQGSLAHISSALRIRKLLKPEDKQDPQPIFEAFSNETTQLPEALECLQLLGELSLDTVEFKEKAKGRFPLAKMFS